MPVLSGKVHKLQLKRNLILLKDTGKSRLRLVSLVSALGIDGMLATKNLTAYDTNT